MAFGRIQKVRHVAVPALPIGETQIEFPLFWRFTSAEYEQVATPTEISYQWRRRVVVFVSLVKLPRTEQIAALKPAKIRMTS